MKNYYTLLIASLFAVSAYVSADCAAAPLTPQQALSRLTAQAPAKARGIAASSPRLIHTEKAEGCDAVFIFDAGSSEGFMLLSADDATPALLGYGDSGNLPEDPSLWPEPFRYWVSTMADQVSFAAKKNGKARAASSKNYGAPIAPLTKTKWNQDAPYNDLCPTVGSKRCYTGCVATAMAQILDYHQFPEKGSGTYSYTWASPEGNKELSFDYGATTFEWADMLDEYGADATAAQKNAVATLMYACGVAVNMKYGTSSSGALTRGIPNVMWTYFGYDKGVRRYDRDYYGIDDWNRLVYDQLSTYGPVQYSGQSNDGGHSFICDGYSEGGYFHINWGWGGMSNGYFLLTALDPDSQGIGGSSSGYDFDQDFIGNVTSEQVSESIYEQIICNNAFTITPTELSTGGTLTMGGTFNNYSAGDIPSLTLGLKLVDTADNTTQYVGTFNYSKLQMFYGFKTYTWRLPSNFSDGKYIVTPAFRNSSGEWQDIPVPVSENGAYIMTVEDGKATLTEQGGAELTATDLTDVTPFYIGSKFTVTATLNNPSEKEYYGNLRFALLDKDTQDIAAFGAALTVDISAGETLTDWPYSSSLYVQQGTTLEAGTYLGCLFAEASDGGLTLIAGPIDIELKAQSTPNFIQVSSQKITIPDIQLKGRFNATAEVELKGGYFYGTLRFGIAEYKSGETMYINTWIDSEPVMLLVDNSPATRAANDIPSKMTVKFDGAFPDGEEGKEYYGVIYVNNSQISQGKRFSFQYGTPVGTPEIDNESEVVEKEYISLTGISYGSHRPTQGICIVRSRHADGHISTAREVMSK